MTNEETIEQINILKAFTGYDKDNPIIIKLHEALDMAIKALETTCIEDYPTCTECEHYDKEKHYCPRFCQVIKDTLAEAQPSEDCISREAVIDGLASIAKAKAKSDAQKALMGRVMFFTEHLPSVTPKYTDEEIDKAQAVEQAYVDKMVELAIEEIKRPKGKWIITYPDGGRVFKCNQCNKYADIHYATDYCPNCGSYNGGNDNGDE